MLDATILNGVGMTPRLGQQELRRLQPRYPVHETFGRVAGQHGLRLDDRGQPKGRAEHQSQQTQCDKMTEATQPCLPRLYNQQKYRPGEQRRRGQQHGQVVRQHKSGHGQPAPQGRSPARASFRACDLEQRQQQQWYPDEGQLFGQRAARPRIRQMIGRPGVGHGRDGRAPRPEQLAGEQEHGNCGQHQASRQRQLQRCDEARAQPIKNQPAVIAQRCVEVEHREAIAKALVGQPAGAQMARPQRQVEVEEAKQVMHAVVGLLQTGLPERTERRNDQQQRQNQRQPAETIPQRTAGGRAWVVWFGLHNGHGSSRMDVRSTASPTAAPAATADRRCSKPGS